MPDGKIIRNWQLYGSRLAASDARFRNHVNDSVRFDTCVTVPNKWSMNFDERPHRRGGADFSRGKVNVAPASREQCSWLQQSRWCRYSYFAASTAAQQWLIMFFIGSHNPRQFLLSLGNLNPHLLIRGSLGHPSDPPKRHLDLFGRFCRAHERNQQTDRPRCFLCSNKAHLCVFRWSIKVDGSAEDPPPMFCVIFQVSYLELAGFTYMLSSSLIPHENIVLRWHWFFSPFLFPNQQCQCTERNSIDWLKPGSSLSWYTANHLKEGTFLPMCRLCDAITVILQKIIAQNNVSKILWQFWLMIHDILLVSNSN